MKYAVIKLSGSQFKVQEGDKLEVIGHLGEKGKILEINEVLLISDGDKIKLGKPLVAEAKVKAEILEEKSGEKVIVGKFKAKTGYHRKNGFRENQTSLLIKEIIN